MELVGISELRVTGSQELFRVFLVDPSLAHDGANVVFSKQLGLFFRYAHAATNVGVTQQFNELFLSRMTPAVFQHPCSYLVTRHPYRLTLHASAGSASYLVF